MATLLTALASPLTDNTMPVRSLDGAGICTIGTDCIFDALNPAGYVAGALPTTGTAVPAGGLVNLARDTAPAIAAVMSRTGPVTAVPEASNPAWGPGGTVAPTFDGKGINIGGASGTKYPLRVLKGGVPSNRVGEPAEEDFASVLELCWVRVVALGSTGIMAIYGAGDRPGASANRLGDVTCSASSTLLTATSGTGVAAIGTPALGQLVQVGMLRVFDTVAGTTIVTPIYNGVLGTPVAGPAPSSYVVNDGGTGFYLGNCLGFDTTGAKTIYRFVREYVGISGVNPATFAAAEYAWVTSTARFA